MKHLFLFILCSFSLPVFAEISLCNERSESFLISVGVEINDEIIVVGWEDLPSGTCAASIHDMFQRAGKPADHLGRVWVHGRNRLSSASREEGSGLELCVDDIFDRFRAEFADSTCEKRGYIRAAFTELDLSRSRIFGTVVLTGQGFIFRP